MDQSSTPVCPTCRPAWRLPLLLALVLAGIWLARSTVLREASHPGDTQHVQSEIDAVRDTVTLTIVFADGQHEKYPPIAWRETMTIYDLMRESSDGQLRLEVRGSGAAAFLAGIDGITNEGIDGRNWMYWVNGQHGDRSFAVYQLRPHDDVLWSFAPRD